MQRQNLTHEREHPADVIDVGVMARQNAPLIMRMQRSIGNQGALRYLRASNSENPDEKSRGASASPSPMKLSAIASSYPRLQRKCGCQGEEEQCEECGRKKEEEELILRRAPALGWTGNKDNAGKLAVPVAGGKTVDRIPIENLSAPSVSGRVIVLVPSGINLAQPVDILFHLHGHNEGYEKLRDRDIEKIEEQLAGSARGQMIAILPQGTSGSSFGKSGAGLDSDTYIDSVFDALKSLGIWATKPKPGQVLLSAHSGGGGPIGEEMIPGKSGASLPKDLKVLALFDAINGPHECKAVADWITSRLDHDLIELQKTGITLATQTQYLASSTKFRGFHTGAATTTASDSINASYASRYAWVQSKIDGWFKSNAAAVSGLPPAIKAALQSNYSIQSISATTDLKIHNQAVALGSHLQSSITDMPAPAPAPTTKGTVQPSRSRASAGRAGSVPESVGHALQSCGQPLPSATRQEMESSFGADFTGVRVHHDSTAARAARSVDALAFTVGRDIVFGGGQYAPQTEVGRRLLAHELTHTLQQKQAAPPADWQSLRIGPEHDSFESEASAHERLGETGAPHSQVGGPLVQRQPDQRTLREQFCEDPAKKLHTDPGTCTYREPENCAIYGDWVSSFARLKTFKTSDTAPGGAAKMNFTAFGEQAASSDPKAAADKQPESFTGPRTEDRFVDHPTDKWVKECLPDNLRATAYQLPSDCADIAVILRHVWLSAHHRTETISSKWVIGDKAGGPAQKAVGKIIGEVYTGNVKQMLNPYLDEKGNPVRTFAKLEPLLHSGDILVWEHHERGLGTGRSGGHTHTITNVLRAGGKIQELTLLQGNEPIFDPNYAEISQFLKDENKTAKKKTPIPSRKDAGDAPGRRIEIDTFKQDNLRDLTPEKTKGMPKPEPAWTWADGNTTLVAAGPPRSAARPGMRTLGGVKVPRISDWFGALKSATQESLQGVFEAALAEARSIIEGGAAIVESDASEIGRIAGQKIWDWAKAKPEFGNKSHFEPLRRLQETVRGFGDLDFPEGFFGRLITALGVQNPHEDEVRRVFRMIESAFVDAARGGSSIDFTRKIKKGVKVVNTLLTGFDPFTGREGKPAEGEWNPSGAAVLELDGKSVDVEAGVTAAVEGIVLPVSFDEFRAGLVERIIKPQMGNLDAVLTVSLDNSITTGAVRMERFAVGVHKLDDGKLERIPAAPGGTEGPRIIEAPAPIDKIATDTEQKDKDNKVVVQKPTFGNDIKLKFHSAADANKARAELNMTAVNSDELVIDNPATVRLISSTAKIALTSAIHFQVVPKGIVHEADLLRGPGGDFLSNEVSYRAQRLLAESKSSRNPVSFHTHVPGTGELLPADAKTPEGKAVLARAKELKDKLITTLKSMIAAVARIIAHR